ncbi:MAG: hypothetical protein QGH02_05240 [Verrucomicrobiota bacterium]|nr:hypothetical protein [Verrucomicrobiota bacterium]
MRRTAQAALAVHRFAGRSQAAVRDPLVGPGDLPVTTDFRDVLIPILRRHGKTFPRPRADAAWASGWGRVIALASG